MHRRQQRTVPLQKSTTVYPGLASSVTMATKLFSCCRFLTARMFDIFPAKRQKRKEDLNAGEDKEECNRFLDTHIIQVYYHCMTVKLGWLKMELQEKEKHDF